MGNLARKLLAAFFVSIILLFLILPTLIIVPMSFSQTDYLQFPPQGLSLRWYAAYFGDPDWMASTWFSLKIALATALTSTVVGTMASLAFVRGELPFKGVFGTDDRPDDCSAYCSGCRPLSGFAPHQLTGTFSGFLVSHTVLSVPFVMITVVAALQRFDPALELAALNCGAGRGRAFFHITLPMIAPSIGAGFVFAFLASFDEATVAFFISDINGKTIGRKMFEDIDFNLTPTIAAASTVVVPVSMCLIALSFALTRSKQN